MQRLLLRLGRLLLGCRGLLLPERDVNIGEEHDVGGQYSEEGGVLRVAWVSVVNGGWGVEGASPVSYRTLASHRRAARAPTMAVANGHSRIVARTRPLTIKQIPHASKVGRHGHDRSEERKHDKLVQDVTGVS